jgi:hypothetical protein
MSSTSTVPGSANDSTREAVLTASPITIPVWTAPTSTAASPVRMPTRSCSSGIDRRCASSATAVAMSRPARTERSASSSRATGAPQKAITASPMNFWIVPP